MKRSLLAVLLLLAWLPMTTDAAVCKALATYGVGYVARPIGAFFLGHWGDTHGRKNVLILCMFLMGFSTVAVGLLLFPVQMPPPPGRLSTTTPWLHDCESLSATKRAKVSAAPPGGKGTSRRIGLLG